MLANPQKKKKAGRVQGSGALAKKPAAKPASSIWSQPATTGAEDDGEEEAPKIFEPIKFNMQAQILQEEKPYPKGLFKTLNFLTEAEEDALLTAIDRCRWSNDLQRRTQQYGYKFCYVQNSLEDAAPIPAFYDEIIDKLCQVTDQEGHLVFPQRPNQLIVNEYTPGQGIHAHIDRDLFEDGIVAISLLSDIQMIFDSDLSHTGRTNVIETDPQQKMQIQPLTPTMVPVWLDRRSLIVMRDESRYKWSHEIPARAHDSKNGRIVRRQRRISVTFRRVKNYCKPRPKSGKQAKPKNAPKPAPEPVPAMSNLTLEDPSM